MTPTDFDSFSASQLINENLLSEWLDQPTSTPSKMASYWQGTKIREIQERVCSLSGRYHKALD